MDVFTTYLYFWGSLVGVIVFIIFYLARKDLRSEMLRAGVAVGIVGIFSEYVFFKDYWMPQLLFQLGPFGGVEDFIFGLTAGGVGTVLYKTLFHKRLRYSGNPHFWIVPLIIISELGAIIVLHSWFGVNSIFASAAGFVIPTVVICFLRRDLIVETVFSAVVGGSLLVLAEGLFLLFAPSYLEKYFLLHNRVDLILGIVPITELIWGMGLGALLGPLYEFDYGDSLVNLPKTKVVAKKLKQRG